MARVIAFVPDLLFGSRVLEAVRAAGHDAVLAADAGALERALPGAGGVIVDLTADAGARIDAVAERRSAQTPVLAFYSHVEADVREQAREAGFELVVPRSRMAREGTALVGRVFGAAGPAGGGPSPP